MPLASRSSAYSLITAIAARRAVHAAFAWLHGNPKTLMDWQRDLVKIPAPPYGEQARSEWLAARFREASLHSVEVNSIGNVFGIIPAASLPPESTGHVIVLSAHIDTVFPAGTLLQPIVEGDRLMAPGASDNAAGVVGMLAIAHALLRSGIELPVPLVFLGNVGEEGEGDLRGVRHLYRQGALAEASGESSSSRLSSRIAAHIVLDGAGADTAVTQALGSIRFLVTINGPGGHSFSDAGTPNPIAALASALSTLAETSLPVDPRTTLNIGTIRGGTSVNSIPESAQASVDFRSTAPDQLIRLEVALHRAVEEAVARANAHAPLADGATRRALRFTITKIGDRPAASLPDGSPLLAALRAVDRHLGLSTDLRLGSTDANIPLSLDIPALAMGAGGEGGGAHTLAEWYSARNRETGLRRVLLLTLAALEWAAQQ